MPKVNLSESSLKIREKTTALFREYAANRTVRLRNKIVNLNAGLVHRTARKYAAKIDSTITPREELEQLGFIGLIKAVERFDNSKDGAFVTFAGLYVEGEMQHWNRSVKGLKKVPVALTELHSKVLKYQRTIQKLRPNEHITIEYVIKNCPQLNLTMARWREIEQASKAQHYAPIDCQSEDDVFVQVPDDEQNTLAIAGELEQRSQQLAILRRRMIYALEDNERTIVNEYSQGVSLATIAIRNKLTEREVQLILNTSIVKLKTCS